MKTITSTAGPMPVTNQSYYDLAALHEMSGGNQEFILSLIRIFLDTIPPNSKEMLQCSKDGNWDMVSKLAHKLKSTIDMMRMESIKQDIRVIEMDARNQVNKELIVALVKKVDLIITATARQLRNEFQLA